MQGIVFFQREAYMGRQPLSNRPDRACAPDEFGSSSGLMGAVYRAGRLLESTRAFCVVEMGS
jgi:hypothetical protein